jgi:membrane protein required for colicin V production
MNGLDWAILGVIGLLVVAGLWKGLIRLVFAVLSVAVALVLACLSTGIGTEALTPIIRNPAVAAIVSFIVVFIILLVIMGLVGRLLSKAIHVLGLGWVDRFGGAVLGLAGALLIVGGAFLVIELAGQENHPIVKESRLAPMGAQVAGTLRGALPEDIRDMIEDRREPLEGMDDLIEKGKEQLEKIPDEVKERLPEEV